MDTPESLHPPLDQRWQLVLPHREHLLVVARRRCASSGDAEDCVHDALLRAVCYAALEPSRVAALLTALVLRAAADQARRRHVEHRGRLRLVLLPAQVGTAPEEAALDGAEARWLAGEVRRLPHRERDVLACRASGLDPGQTARSLRLSGKAVESAFTRARQRLRDRAAR